MQLKHPKVRREQANTDLIAVRLILGVLPYIHLRDGGSHPKIIATRVRLEAVRCIKLRQCCTVHIMYDEEPNPAKCIPREDLSEK